MAKKHLPEKTLIHDYLKISQTQRHSFSFDSAIPHCCGWMCSLLIQLSDAKRIDIFPFLCFFLDFSFLSGFPPLLTRDERR